MLNVWYSLSSGLNKIAVMLLYMDFRGSYFSSCNQFNIQWLEIQRAPEKIRSHYPCVEREDTEFYPLTLDRTKWLNWDHENYIYPKVTDMGSLIDHRIGYNGIGVVRD